MKMRTLIAVAVAALFALTGCVGAQSSTASVPASSTPAVSSAPEVSLPTSSQAASSEDVSSVDVSSQAASSEATSSEITSSEATSSQPVPVTDLSSHESAVIDIANAKRSAAGKSGSLTENSRLTAAARQAATLLSQAGGDFIKSSDYRSLPDGSSLTSLVNSIDSEEGKLSGISYAVWVRNNPEDPSDVSALQSDVLSGTRFAEKALGDFSYIGVGISCVNPDTMVLVIYYAADIIG